MGSGAGRGLSGPFGSAQITSRTNTGERWAGGPPLACQSFTTAAPASQLAWGSHRSVA